MSWSAMVHAQDLQRISERDIMGTARYVGMAGAMTAIGGDASAAMDNPAGLGLYRHMEVSLTTDMRFDRGTALDSRLTFSVPQASWVIPFYSGRTRGVVSNSLMFSYRRLKSFDRVYSTDILTEPYSLCDVATLKTNGLAESALSLPAGSSDTRWDNPDLGWLSIAAYENYLIDPSVDKPTEWVAPLADGETVKSHSLINERGSIDEYGLTWGMNISHRLYIGAALNLQSVSYTKTQNYYEQLSANRSIENIGYVSYSGIGFNGSLGLLYRPIRALRMGVSIQTPSILSMRLASKGTLSARGFTSDNIQTETPYYNAEIDDMRLPMRLSVGLGWQIAQAGLISLQYDLQNYKNLNPWHSFKIGGELYIKKRLLINAGYAYGSSFIEEYFPVCLGETSISMDTDTRYLATSQHISAGVGYRGVWGLIQMAYQCHFQTHAMFAHELASRYDQNIATHRIVLTLNWHTR